MSGRLVLPPGAFRLLLAGLVLVSHLSNFQVGRLGVMLFFLLSGFWISDLWRRQGPLGIKVFFLNRFLRIWPLYICAVAFGALVLSRHVGLTNVTIFGVATQGGEKPLGVEWSLDIEAQFYLLLPIIMTLRPPAWTAVPATILGWTIVLTLGIQNVFMYLPAFLAGIWLYRRREQPLRLGSANALGVFALGTLVILLVPALRPQLTNEGVDFINQDIFAMLWGVPLIFYVGHSLRCKSTALDRHLGNLSFPVYLLHEPIIRLLYPNDLLDKLIIVVAVFAASIFVYVVVDIPIEKFRYRILKAVGSKVKSNEIHTDENLGVGLGSNRSIP